MVAHLTTSARRGPEQRTATTSAAGGVGRDEGLFHSAAPRASVG